MLSMHEHVDALDLNLDVFWLDCDFFLLADKAAYICCQG